MWRWDQAEPFGNNPADENPSGLGAFDLPLRLPGQRYDKETGLAYNMARDYALDTGRYIQSDPIGLTGGINTYAYVGSSPLLRVDPRGLQGATTADTLVCIFNPVDCADVRRCRDLALQATLQEFGRQGNNDAADAFRHCYWSCCMTQRIGAKSAKRHGDAHEEFPSNLQCEKDMDLYNNGVGRSVAQANPTGDCRTMCKGAPTQNQPTGACTPCGTYDYYPR